MVDDLPGGARQVSFFKVNLDTGGLSGQKNVALGLDSRTDSYDLPTSIQSHDHLAWYALNDIWTDIFAFDPKTGVITYRWP